MIVVRTPLRISFLGGGTDFPSYYRNNGGRVITSAIDRYIFVIVKDRFDDQIRVAYSKTEIVDNIDDLQHEIVRECLRKTGVTSGVEIATMADIPSTGSGLGSSSTVTVGVLNALYHYTGRQPSPEQLAREACEIELHILGKPIGVQDQYIAAYGGQRAIDFAKSGAVSVSDLSLTGELKRQLGARLMMFYTNKTRKAESVLTEQRDNIDSKQDRLGALTGLADEAQYFLESGYLDDFGKCLDRGWRLKRELASGITNSEIDALYERAIAAGAIGGKIAGAGGGGFLLVYCKPEKQHSVREALQPLRELRFNLEPDGSSVIYHHDWDRGIPVTAPGLTRNPASVPAGAPAARRSTVLAADAV
jgi:D-glycero-alpha-D-manno-heptose-7-phosphate kinase